MSVEFPRVETQVFRESPEMAELLNGLPEARRALFEIGIPKNFISRRYEADWELAIVTREGRPPVVRFGTSALAEAIGVDVSSGNVVEVVVDVPEKQTNLVNTTVDLFTSTVRALVERFPYYPRDAEWAEIDRVCAELHEIIRSIDAEAAAPGCYWPGWVDDVQMGDFSTEDILAPEE